MNGSTGSTGTQVIRMDGVFDVPAAQQLARTLAQSKAGEVAIDLTHVREFHDFGVSVLAQALAARDARVAIRGLRQHHLRLLRYFGVDLGQFDLGGELEAV